MTGVYNGEDYEVAAAMDIGTTFSTYAYSYKGSEKDIRGCKDWGANLGVVNLKAPTSVLVDKDGKFVAFGYEAQEMYKSMEPEDARLYSLHERFKMQLMHGEELSRVSKTRAIDGRDLPLIKIFTMTIKYLKDHLRESMARSSSRHVDPSKIRWVITVPAIWSDAAKQFTREAAYEAGVGSRSRPKQLIIALEPEVAGLYCASKDMDQFVQTSTTPRSKSQALGVGAEYLVMDCGGGTLDTTSYKIETNKTLKQTYQATGSDLGGTKVDDAFVQFLKKVIGDAAVTTFKKESPVGWLQLMCSFDHKKRGIKNDSNDKMNLEIPYSMHEIIFEATGKKFTDIVNQQRIHGVRCNAGILVINHEIIQKIFRKSVQSIVDHMTKLMQSPQLKNVSQILMVGGFSESPILQSAIREAFGDKVKVLIPDDASLCVLKGAVAFGHNPKVITSRIARMTYGEAVDVPYDRLLHGANKQRVKLYGTREFQTGVMDCYVKRGQVINVGQVKELVGHAITADQTAMGHFLFCSDNYDVKYVDEDGVKPVGSWQTPLEGRGLNRSVQIRIFFGETELFVQSRQSGKDGREWVQQTFEFLSREKY
ncbi:hypothetical protein CAPTEDRAFT_151163 [Capitella teleta]|uniref:Heat shock 70 kDa protein 12A n=1 Tax=Capitella teleta TaxID=283909 RepID=R7UYY0_CAPTE|nr:hypothetical protein CAPTEDRAFT_151163 [Capitella teleta]|eukprot:ELU08606.1 hypothetical protein CAPTEDRAFT_151163 [Capitella teleta]